jgi:PAS domain-containing protein
VIEQRRAFEVAQGMEAIMESSQDAIIAITLEGHVTSWNPAAEPLFGYTGEEVIGKSAETVTPRIDPARWRPSWPSSVPASTWTTWRPSEFDG